MGKIKIISKRTVALPLILGILALLTFLIYFYSANHAPYKYIDIIFVVPVFSSVGMIASIIIRKSRKTYPTLWTSGFILCVSIFMLCMAILLLLMIVL